MAAASRPEPPADEASHGGGPGGAPAGGLASVAPVHSPTAEHPPVLKPIAENTAPTTCQHCGEVFTSRNKLFDHLRTSGHSQFYAPRSAGDSASVSGLSAGSQEPSAASDPLQRAAADAAVAASGMSQERGGSTGSAFASLDARSKAVVLPKGSQDATPRLGKGQGARPY